MNKEELRDFIVESLEEKKAENIVCMSLKGEVPIADYMIFASGRSVKNIRAIAEYVALELKHKLQWNASVEGLQGSDWILLDAGNVIVHMFHPEAREHLKLEEFWQARK
jgi:ribosome-associated protein